MIEWLIGHFVSDASQTDSPAVRASYGRLASVVSIACNVVLACGKLAVGILAHSVSIMADAANSITDAASNAVALLGFKLASRPPDAEHPYGHGRYEYLAALGVSVLVAFIGLNLMRDAILRILAPQPVNFDALAYVVLVASIAVKLWMGHLNATLARRISSGVLEATAMDSRADAIATTAVLVTGLVSSQTGIVLDGWTGLGVGAFILWNGIQLVRETIDTLLGRAPDPELVQRVRKRVMETPGVLGMHDLMVHDYGPGRLFASAHVEMAPNGSVVEDHELLDGIERDLWERERLLITLHLDPLERSKDMATVFEAEQTSARNPRTDSTPIVHQHGQERDEQQREEPTMPERQRGYKAKQMIVMRRDLRMRKGKIAAQAAHACVEATLMALAREDRLDQVRVTPDESWVWLDDAESEVTPLSSWFDAGVAKVCVYVDGEDALLELAVRGRELGFACALVRDAGITEFHGEPTYTCLAFEPLYPEQIDPLTGELPLY